MTEQYTFCSGAQGRMFTYCSLPRDLQIPPGWGNHAVVLEGSLLEFVKVVASFDPHWPDAAAVEALRSAHLWLLRGEGRDVRYDRMRRRAREIGREDCLHALTPRPGRDAADMLFADLLETLDDRYGRIGPEIGELEVVGLAASPAVNGLLCLYAFDEVWPTPHGFVALRPPRSR